MLREKNESAGIMVSVCIIKISIYSSISQFSRLFLHLAMMMMGKVCEWCKVKEWHKLFLWCSHVNDKYFYQFIKRESIRYGSLFLLLPVLRLRSTDYLTTEPALQLRCTKHMFTLKWCDENWKKEIRLNLWRTKLLLHDKIKNFNYA